MLLSGCDLNHTHAHLLLPRQPGSLSLLTCPEGSLLQPLFEPQAVIRKKVPVPGKGCCC